MANNNVIQYASRGMTEIIDNLVLQQLIKAAADLKIKNEEMLCFQLNRCEWSGRQRFFFDSEEDDSRDDIEFCMFCQKPVNEVALVYQYENSKNEVIQLYCLESEGEALLQVQQ